MALEEKTFPSGGAVDLYLQNMLLTNYTLTWPHASNAILWLCIIVEKFLPWKSRKAGRCPAVGPLDAPPTDSRCQFSPFSFLKIRSRSIVRQS